ncbi:MAG TPA: phosphatidate cytidylyltransferase [Haliangiales bacterium]|nr:phosphatidate cytidylyltransferase [Haliangiales bacterium]
MKLGNLALRVITVAPLVPLLLLAILWSRNEAFFAVVTAACALCVHEWFGMAFPEADRIDRAFCVAGGAAVAALAIWGGGAGALAWPLAVIAPSLYFLFRFKDLAVAGPRLALTIAGWTYAGLLLTFIARLKAMSGSWVLLTLMIAWFGDTAAYFAGRLFGKAKLYPAVSPGKTWAGAIGGLVGSFGGAALANLWYFPALGWGHGAVISVVGGAIGQSGDLVESMLKRSFGVKDSGNILPGHGGILDRVDAVLFISPWVCAYAVTVWS